MVILPPKPKAGDSQIFVEIDPEEMEAKVTVLPPDRGGSPANLERVRATLATNGVVYGLHGGRAAPAGGPHHLHDRPEKVYEAVEAVIAKGKPVIHGTDAYLEKYYDKKKEEEAPKAPNQVENKNARVDYRDLNVIENVGKGTVLAKKIPLTEG